MDNIFSVFLFFLLGISLTIFFVYRINFGPVGGASFMMLLTGILDKTVLSGININFTNVMVISAFIAMSSNEIIKNTRDIVILSFTATLYYLNFLSVFTGIGGSMGMAAFITVITYYSIKWLKN
jgi:hypothetical protein